jgi:hypothetical protein
MLGPRQTMVGAVLTCGDKHEARDGTTLIAYLCMTRTLFLQARTVLLADDGLTIYQVDSKATTTKRRYVLYFLVNLSALLCGHCKMRPFRRSCFSPLITLSDPAPLPIRSPGKKPADDFDPNALRVHSSIHHASSFNLIRPVSTPFLTIGSSISMVSMGSASVRSEGSNASLVLPPNMFIKLIRRFGRFRVSPLRTEVALDKALPRSCLSDGRRDCIKSAMLYAKEPITTSDAAVLLSMTVKWSIDPDKSMGEPSGQCVVTSAWISSSPQSAVEVCFCADERGKPFAVRKFVIVRRSDLFITSAFLRACLIRRQPFNTGCCKASGGLVIKQM